MGQLTESGGSGLKEFTLVFVISYELTKLQAQLGENILIELSQLLQLLAGQFGWFFSFRIILVVFPRVLFRYNERAYLDDVFFPIGPEGGIENITQTLK